MTISKYYKTALRGLVPLALLGLVTPVLALTAPGEAIENTASLDYTVAGTPVSTSSNTTTTTVQELVDVDVTLVDTADVPVAPGDTDQVATFLVTNTGNGDEAYLLSVDTAVAGDEFDPDTSTIFIESDGVPGYSAGDTLYDPLNPPIIGSEEAITVYVVSDIPTGVINGDTADVELTASSNTIVDTPGTASAGDGDAGTDAVAGSSGGDDAEIGGYVVSEVVVTFDKTQVVSDPFGGSEPVPGATITYTLSVTVSGSGTATGIVLSDPIPVNTTYVDFSITLDGAAQTDSSDSPTDEAEFDVGGDQIVVTLGDIVAGGVAQVVTFQVTID
ncbi:MAG: hypothetical protein V7721_01650 [Porticoccaceae bacterium]